MFDINNARDFYQKLLDDFDDFMQPLDSARELRFQCTQLALSAKAWPEAAISRVAIANEFDALYTVIHVDGDAG